MTQISLQTEYIMVKYSKLTDRLYNSIEIEQFIFQNCFLPSNAVMAFVDDDDSDAVYVKNSNKILVLMRPFINFIKIVVIILNIIRASKAQSVFFFSRRCHPPLLSHLKLKVVAVAQHMGNWYRIISVRNSIFPFDFLFLRKQNVFIFVLKPSCLTHTQLINHLVLL